MDKFTPNTLVSLPLNFYKNVIGFQTAAWVSFFRICPFLMPLITNHNKTISNFLLHEIERIYFRFCVWVVMNNTWPISNRYFRYKYHLNFNLFQISRHTDFVLELWWETITFRTATALPSHSALLYRPNLCPTNHLSNEMSSLIADISFCCFGWLNCCGYPSAHDVWA